MSREAPVACNAEHLRGLAHRLESTIGGQAFAPGYAATFRAVADEIERLERALIEAETNRGEWRKAAEAGATASEALKLRLSDGVSKEHARVREIFSRRLNLHYDQRAYSWHEIQDALSEVEGRNE